MIPRLPRTVGRTAVVAGAVATAIGLTLGVHTLTASGSATDGPPQSRRPPSSRAGATTPPPSWRRCRPGCAPPRATPGLGRRSASPTSSRPASPPTPPTTPRPQHALARAQRLAPARRADADRRARPWPPRGTTSAARCASPTQALRRRPVRRAGRARSAPTRSPSSVATPRHGPRPSAPTTSTPARRPSPGCPTRRELRGDLAGATALMAAGAAGGRHRVVVRLRGLPPRRARPRRGHAGGRRGGGYATRSRADPTYMPALAGAPASRSPAATARRPSATTATVVAAAAADGVPRRARRALRRPPGDRSSRAQQYAVAARLGRLLAGQRRGRPTWRRRCSRPTTARRRRR